MASEELSNRLSEPNWKTVKAVKLSNRQFDVLRERQLTIMRSGEIAKLIAAIYDEAARRDKDLFDAACRIAGYRDAEDVQRQGLFPIIDWATRRVIIQRRVETSLAVGRSRAARPPEPNQATTRRPNVRDTLTPHPKETPPCITSKSS